MSADVCGARRPLFTFHLSPFLDESGSRSGADRKIETSDNQYAFSPRRFSYIRLLLVLLDQRYERNDVGQTSFFVALLALPVRCLPERTMPNAQAASPIVRANYTCNNRPRGANYECNSG